MPKPASSQARGSPLARQQAAHFWDAGRWSRGESVLGRVIGLAWLVILGGALLFAGFTNGTLGDSLLGLVALVGAGYSWSYTRS